jgi:hypothetical protein
VSACTAAAVATKNVVNSREKLTLEDMGITRK